MISYNTALEITRENTGKHFLDSGGASGRHWQQPAPDESPITLDEKPWDIDGSCQINLTKLLADLWEYHTGLHKVFDHIADDNNSWMEDVYRLADMLGYEEVARDNTYNSENDLDQNFVYSVFEAKDHHSGDWLWADFETTDYDPPLHYLFDHCDSTEEAEELADLVDGWALPFRFIVIQTHNGADVRGGYSSPQFGYFEGEYAIPIDLSVEWYIGDPSLIPQRIEAMAPDEDDESDLERAEDMAESYNDRGEFSRGYSSNPSYHAESEGFSLAEDEEGNNIGWVKDDNGIKYLAVCHDDCGLVVFPFYPGRPYMGE
jgi:hypothetical protein